MTIRFHLLFLLDFQMEGNLPPPQYTPDQKLFCVMSKNKGATTDQIRQEFSEKWPTKNPPTRKSIFNFEKQLNEKKNLADQRKGKSGRRFTVRTQENIQSVKHLLESEKDRKPDIRTLGFSTIIL